MESSTSVERLGRTELLFREVNERIREIAARFGLLDVALFVCECGQGDCAEAIELELREYDALRSSPRTFVMVPGHEAAHEKVITRQRRYNLVLVGQGQPARLFDRNV
jgi:AraC-like DNA-binding protein